MIGFFLKLIIFHQRMLFRILLYMFLMLLTQVLLVSTWVRLKIFLCFGTDMFHKICSNISFLKNRKKRITKLRIYLKHCIVQLGLPFSSNFHGVLTVLCYQDLHVHVGKEVQIPQDHAPEQVFS